MTQFQLMKTEFTFESFLFLLHYNLFCCNSQCLCIFTVFYYDHILRDAINKIQFCAIIIKWCENTMWETHSDRLMWNPFSKKDGKMNCGNGVNMEEHRPNKRTKIHMAESNIEFIAATVIFNGNYLSISILFI